MNGWQTHIADLLREAAPHDLAAPIYLVSWPAVVQWIGPVYAGAVTRATLDLDLQPYLQHQGRWQGRGYAAAVNAASLSDVQLLGLCLHEAGHWLDCPPPVGSAAAVAELARSAGWQPDQQTLSEYMSRLERQQPPGPPWDGHEDRFIRAALHLWARFPVGVPPDLLGVAGARYQLSACWRYRLALDSELQEQDRNTPIREVLDRPAPQPFTQLFAEDTSDDNQGRTEICL